MCKDHLYPSLMVINQYSRYNLGPNGGILTALNLFTTKFDQVLSLVEKRSHSIESVQLPLNP